MNIQEIYDFQKKNFLFSGSNKFELLRKKLLKEFDLSSKKMRNNESLKHLDPNILKFNYDYNIKNKDIEYKDTKEEFININVIDGRINKVQNNL